MSQTLFNFIPKKITSAYIIIEPGLTPLPFLGVLTESEIEHAKSAYTGWSYVKYERTSPPYRGYGFRVDIP